MSNKPAPLISTFTSNTGTQAFRIFPNPGAGDFRLSFYAEMENPVSLKVLDLRGQLVFSENFEAVAGLNEKAFTLGKIPAGIYLLQMQAGQKTWSEKLIVNAR